MQIRLTADGGLLVPVTRQDIERIQQITDPDEFVDTGRKLRPASTSTRIAQYASPEEAIIALGKTVLWHPSRTVGFWAEVGGIQVAGIIRRAKEGR